MRRLRTLLVPAALLVVLASCSEPQADPGQGTGETVTIAAVGDIACNSFPEEHARRCRYDRVADLVGSLGVDAFLALGDLQYLRGSYNAFTTFYDREFGDLFDITYPSPGNHETYTPYMGGYFRYWGKRAIAPQEPWWYPDRVGWYSFDLGDWHIVSLNSQLCKGSTWWPGYGHGQPITRNTVYDRGCGPGTSEYEWLRKDLELNQDHACSLAFFHHPVFFYAPWRQTFGALDVQPLYDLLDKKGVDVILNGHYHNYQRFAQQDAFGNADPEGPAQFIVGTGGDTYEDDFPVGELEPPPNLVVYQGDSLGVLRMTLEPTSYDFEFVVSEGEIPFTDSGADVPCA